MNEINIEFCFNTYSDNRFNSSMNSNNLKSKLKSEYPLMGDEEIANIVALVNNITVRVQKNNEPISIY